MIYVYAKQQTWICTTWPSFPLIFRLLFIASKQKQVFYVSFNHMNRSGLFLSVYFLFWEIRNSSVTFILLFLTRDFLCHLQGTEIYTETFYKRIGFG